MGALGNPERAISRQLNEWFPAPDDRILGTKLAEEVGEVCGALIKLAEGRASEADLADELGDLLIVASRIAGRRGWSLESLRAERWAFVCRRAQESDSVD